MVKYKEESTISLKISLLKNSHLSDLVNIFPSICLPCIYKREERRVRETETENEQFKETEKNRF